MIKMKKVFTNVIELVLVVGVIVALFNGLSALDRHERNRAIERCGSESNLIEKYTSTGETYYQCKVEK